MKELDLRRKVRENDDIVIPMIQVKICEFV